MGENWVMKRLVCPRLEGTAARFIVQLLPHLILGFTGQITRIGDLCDCFDKRWKWYNGGVTLIEQMLQS